MQITTVVPETMSTIVWMILMKKIWTKIYFLIKQIYGCDRLKNANILHENIT